MKLSNIVVLTCICFMILLSGCITQENDIIPHENLDLSTVGLALSDFFEDYEIISEEHITEPYVVQEGLVFEGWRIIEKFESSFRTNPHTFIIQQLSKHSSIFNASLFIDEIKYQEFDYDFTLYSEEAIGDNSYIAFSQAKVFEKDSTLYLISYSIDNIAVVLVSSFHDYETALYYAQIIEEKITEKIER
ncbi:MAG: hypothetical protein QCI00_06830 [Candidatus Thermoplasmatota archaeon]|nr:hypothetical protein [Candidatus Thermoplasmatota archaeon]